MKNILALPEPPDTEPPLDSDLETWARTFVLTPAVTARQHRDRFIVSDLLAQLEASR